MSTKCVNSLQYAWVSNGIFNRHIMLISTETTPLLPYKAALKYIRIYIPFDSFEHPSCWKRLVVVPSSTSHHFTQLHWQRTAVAILFKSRNHQWLSLVSASKLCFECVLMWCLWWAHMCGFYLQSNYMVEVWECQRGSVAVERTASLIIWVAAYVRCGSLGRPPTQTAHTRDRAKPMHSHWSTMPSSYLATY